MLFRRHCLTLAAATLAALAGLPALAQDNSKPLEWVVGYPAGGGSDMVARSVAEQMQKALGRQIVVNNKPGAATNIAADYVAKSNSPGNMAFTADFATLAINPHVYAKLPFNPEKDFVPVGLLARFPLLVVVAANVPAKNWAEFVAWAKAQPDGVNIGSAGAGSPHHLAIELLRERSGLKLNHVPYRGGAPAVQDVLGGQISAVMIDSASIVQHLGSGRVKAIGVANATRMKLLPEIPTLGEQGLADFEAQAWQGLVVPQGTPAAYVTRLNQVLQEALASQAVQSRFQQLALEALPGTPQQMADYARNESNRWGALIRSRGIKVE